MVRVHVQNHAHAIVRQVLRVQHHHRHVRVRPVVVIIRMVHGLIRVLRDTICRVHHVSSARRDIVAQGTTAAMRVLVQRTVPQARPVVHRVQIAQPVITVGMVIRCMILCMNVIKMFHILHRMVQEPRTVITPVVRVPVRFMRGTAVQVVILKR